MAMDGSVGSNYACLLANLRNRIEETDGSIPFSSTFRKSAL
jgi:hypothetical protein